MQPKPEHFGTSYAEVFKDQQVVDAYRYRRPYPDEVFEILANLIIDEPRTILDIGAGTGDIARRMAEVAEQVDAVDFSKHMIEQGQRLPNGDHPHLHWIYGKVEEVQLAPLQFHSDGVLPLKVIGTVTWGAPETGFVR